MPPARMDFRESPKQWSNVHNNINLSQALKVNSHSQFKSSLTT